MLQAGKFSSIMNELGMHKVKVAAIQEVRGKGKGVINKKKHVLYFSGAENNSH